MQDYIRRLIIAGIMALCVALLFLGVKNAEARSPVPDDGYKSWIWPSEGVLTDSFGTRNGEHKGIDIAAPAGSPVFAVDRGQVTKSYFSDTYGHVVFIKHAYGVETVYAHLQERTVQEGEFVEKGALLGKMGSTGDSSGVHLHFEVHAKEWTFDKKNAVDPMMALGHVEIGQAVAAGSEKEPSIETIAVPAQSEANKNSNGKNVAREWEEYVVQAGDTIISIAEKNRLSVAELMKWNNIKGNLIRPGQKLLLRK